jgi:hypothetical protein
MSMSYLRPLCRWKRAFLPGIVAVLLAGCSPSPPIPKLYPVQGTILVGEKVVKEGTIQLRANQAKGNTTWEQPCGALGADGTFELMTNDKPGAPPGWYKVLVMADNFKVVDPPPSPVWPDYPKGFLRKPLVHERYLYFNQTDLEIEVVENPPEEGYVLRLNP